MSFRPACYPEPSAALLASVGPDRAPLLDVLLAPVPVGLFDSPLDGRHVLCLHQGDPVPVSYRMDGHDRQGVRLQGEHCVSPAGSSTRWILSKPATSLLLRLSPSLLRETAEAMGLNFASSDLALSVHRRDPQIERIGWMMQAEDREDYPSGRIFIDSLANALAARLLSLQSRSSEATVKARNSLPTWRLRHVLDYIEAHLDEELSLAELAAVAGFSLSHFKPLFKQTVGVPVHRYVLERRVERARTLLLDGRRSMADIALEAGFSHASHMARCMRRVLGISPSQVAQSRH
ncbi:MAG: helix-turn-helix domain-containing protein [Lysobacter sp.]